MSEHTCRSFGNGSFTHYIILYKRRFIDRRGAVKIMWSDNGTNLVGCANELRSAIREWNQSQINNELLQNSIQWTFNPPWGSHHGGVWERMIRSIRKMLHSLMKQQATQLDDELLATLFCEVEAIINSRPLPELPVDLIDLHLWRRIICYSLIQISNLPQEYSKVTTPMLENVGDKSNI